MDEHGASTELVDAEAVDDSKPRSSQLATWLEKWDALDFVAAGVHFNYLLHFASLYVQLPGLYGSQGILPYVLAPESLSRTLILQRHPLGPAYGAEIGSILGMIFAGLGTAVPWLRQGPVGFFLCFMEWVMWRDLVLAGQSLTSFGAGFDTFEGGLGAAAYAIGGQGLASWIWRWELFRMMIGAGALKVLYCDPSWRNLSALHWHLQGSECPSSLAWYGHWITLHWPRLGHLGTAFALFAELANPLLFFVPDRGCRLLAFAINLLLQGGLAATGNYGPLNLYVALLGTALLHEKRDDSAVGERRAPARQYWLFAKICATGGIGGVLWAAHAFPYHPPVCSLAANVVFSKVLSIVSLTMGFGSLISMTEGLELAGGLAVLGMNQAPLVMMLAKFMQTAQAASTEQASIEIGGNLTWLREAADFLVSKLVKQARIVSNSLPPEIFNLPEGAYPTAPKNGRPTLMLEGADHTEGPWRVVPFRYQATVGEPRRGLPFPFPHFPRLDWLMWGSAYGGVQNQSRWLARLVRGVGEGRPEVLNLLDQNAFEQAFPNGPPAYLRLVAKTFSFTKDGASTAWWTEQPADLVHDETWSKFNGVLLGRPLGSALSRDEAAKALQSEDDSTSSWPRTPLRAVSERLGPTGFVRATAAAALAGAHVLPGAYSTASAGLQAIGSAFLWGDTKHSSTMQPLRTFF